MRLSVHFDSKEFRCRGPECANVEPLVAPELVDHLEALRSLLNANLIPGQKEHVIVIESGARCVTHNQAVGGKPSSQHLYNPHTGLACRAADIWSPTRATREVYQAALEIPGFMGVGVQPPSLDWIISKGRQGKRGYVHVDVRPAPARAQWGYGDDGGVVSLAQVLPRLDLERGTREV